MSDLTASIVASAAASAAASAWSAFSIAENRPAWATPIAAGGRLSAASSDASSSSSSVVAYAATEDSEVIEKKPMSWINLALGAAIQTVEVSTLGQPFEVVKTHMAANRGQNLRTAIKEVYRTSGITGFHQGLIPWAWIEASTKGAVVLFASSEIEYQMRLLGLGKASAGLVGGVGGGICQAYTTMGFCTFMKTVEVTRHKEVGGAKKSTWAVAAEVLKRDGWMGMNKGVTAVAVRQATNWGSRFGISRLMEKLLRGGDPNKELSNGERILSAAVGGALACWNQPIEVIRVEMQSQKADPTRPAKLNIWTTAKHIYKHNGALGFFRGVTPRIGLGVYLTVCMVWGGDELKKKFGEKV